MNGKETVLNIYRSLYHKYTAVFANCVARPAGLSEEYVRKLSLELWKEGKLRRFHWYDGVAYQFVPGSIIDPPKRRSYL